MLNFLKRLFSRKTMPPTLQGGQWSGTAFTDSFKRNRAPTPNELMAELKGVAWTCATLNAAACASNPPILYVGSMYTDTSPKCRTRKLGTPRLTYIFSGLSWRVIPAPVGDSRATSAPRPGWGRARSGWRRG